MLQQLEQVSKSSVHFDGGSGITPVRKSCMQMAAEQRRSKNYVAPVSDWEIGQGIYAEGGSDADCANARQVKAWWVALDADVMCDVVGDAMRHGYDGDEVTAAILEPCWNPKFMW